MLLLLVAACHARILGYNVVYYPDGDGMVLERRGRKTRITTRLCGIDCPETGQLAKDSAKNMLKRLVAQNDYVLVNRGVDVHGTRMVISLLPTNPALQTVSVALIESGLCRVYHQFLDVCSEAEQVELVAAETRAKAQKKGLHAFKQELPWDYRRRIERISGLGFLSFSKQYLL